MNDIVPADQAISHAMKEILNSINAVFEAEGISLPDRQYITIGQASHDCEQLTISFEQLYLGSPGDEAGVPLQCDAPRTIQVQVQLVRCIPKPTRQAPPSVDEMIESADRMTRDAWFLLEGGTQSPPAQWLGSLADITITQAEGGYQAIQLNLTVGVP